MRAIWQYDLPTPASNEGPMTTLNVPVGAKILHIAVGATASTDVTLWFMVDDRAESAERTFLVVATGQRLPAAGAWEWVGTAPHPRARRVWHVLEHLPTARRAPQLEYRPLMTDSLSDDDGGPHVAYVGSIDPAEQLAAAGAEAPRLDDTWTDSTGRTRTWTNDGWA